MHFEVEGAGLSNGVDEESEAKKGGGKDVIELSANSDQSPAREPQLRVGAQIDQCDGSTGEGASGRRVKFVWEILSLKCLWETSKSQLEMWSWADLQMPGWGQVSLMSATYL